MRKPKSETRTIEELRSRHRFCISAYEVARQVRAGRIPKYHEQPDKYRPHCDYPEDKFCAAPDISDASVIRKLHEEPVLPSD